MLADGRVSVSQRLVDYLNILIEQVRFRLLNQFGLRLELVQKVEARCDQMGATERCLLTVLGRLLFLRFQRLHKLFNDLVDHDFGADRALMRQVEAEVD